MPTHHPIFLLKSAGSLFAAAAFAVGCAFAQSSAPSVPAVQQNESSSSLIAELALPEGMGARPTASPASNGGQYGERGGWRKKAASNFALDFGGGFNAPQPDSSNDITWGGQFNVGAGYNFSPRFALLAEYQFMDNKLPGRMIAETGANGGNAHIWSLTLNPIVSLFPKSKHDIYLTGGGGFYRKVTNFTDPELTEWCDFYYGCYYDTTDVVVGHFSSNQGGWSIGAGYQRHIGGANGNGRMKLYMEARYLQIFTPAVTTQPNGLGTTSVSADTKLIPVTFGVRW
jgi:hypothetical protein